MAENSLITDKLKGMIGWSPDPVIFKVEEGAIQRYADAINDSNPIFNDIGYAKESTYGRLICPPGFIGWPAKQGYDMLALPNEIIKAGAPPTLLDGGIEYDFYKTIGAGDVITMYTRIVTLDERETKSGNMLIATMLTKYFNQNGDIAATAKWSLIFR